MSGLIPRLPTQCSVTCSMDSDRKLGSLGSLVPRPSITANTVEGLVKLLRRMMSGRRWETWLIAWCVYNTAVHRKCHASQRPPDVILHRSFTRPSTMLAVEGLVKLLRRMTSGRRWEAWLIAWPSTVLAVIEGLGTVIHFLPTAKKLDFLSNFTSLSSLFLSE